jgi:hypothetical protein
MVIGYIPANSCWVKGAGLDLGGPQGGPRCPDGEVWDGG